MRKRNYTVTIRMNKAEYDLLQNKVKESGQTQQAVVIHAIAGLKIASAEEVEGPGTFPSAARARPMSAPVS